MSLYEIKENYVRLLEMADDPEIDADVFADTLEAITGEFEEKADNYARVIRELEYKVSAYGSEAKAFQNKKSAAEKKIDRLKEALKDAMEQTGKTKFKTALFDFTIRNNKPSVVVDDWRLIPGEFLVEKEPTPNKTEIYKALKEGMTIDGVHLEPSSSLSIK